MAKKVLITGSQGYLGRHLVRALRAEGCEPLAIGRREEPGIIQCDLLNREAVCRLFAEKNPDQIVHAAACVPQALSEYNDASFADQNLRMIENILSGSSAEFVFVSSMTVYGAQDNVLRVEGDAGGPLSDYGESKLRGELLLREAKVEGFAVRIPGLFGGGRCDGLVANLVSSLKSGTEPDLPGMPILWAAMSVTDAARSIARLVEAPAAGFEPINIAYGDTYSINQLVETVSRNLGRFVDYSVNHPDFRFDLRLAKSMGVAPRSGLAAALQELIKSI